MKRTVMLVCCFLMVLSVGACAQNSKRDTSGDEAAIRALVNGPADKVKGTDDVISWSAAYPRPNVRGKCEVAPYPDAREDQRRNGKTTWEMVRLEVAEAGDMAYEFSNFNTSLDLADTQEHISWSGAVLRVWKKVNGEWRITATFQRPLDAPYWLLNQRKSAPK